VRLTINALFMDPISGDIQSFVGGYQDLADRKSAFDW
jgi:tRNA nucleotidyltransferase/poly(A) polymerase